MPSDLSVPRVASAVVAGEVSRNPAKPAPAPANEAAPRPSSAFPNPTLRLDPALALVVIEFRDDSGAVRSTIPTQQQLDAYRSWERSQLGVPPRGAKPVSGALAAETPPIPSAPAPAADATRQAAPIAEAAPPPVNRSETTPG